MPRFHRPRTSRTADARRSGLRRTLAAAALLPAVAGGFALQAWTGQDGSRLFHQVMTHLVNDSPDSLTADALYEKAARGLLANIGDPYAALYSPEQLAEFTRESLRNRYGGLGMSVERLSDTATVTRVFPGAPARAAGIQVGDRIVEVDGVKVVGWQLSKVTERLLGTPGTEVDVVLARRGEGPVRMRVERAVVRVPVVPFTLMLEDGIGYVPLELFSESSHQELERAIAGLRKSGARGYVLDLRGNGGGSLDQAIRISNLFVSRGKEIVRVVYRNAPPEVYVATEPAILAHEPVVVLTDEGSASASEIVAGALQDHDRAVIVGAPTYGKGVVQDLFQLDGGWALKLTTGKWYTPSGRLIHKDRDEEGPEVEAKLTAAQLDSVRRSRPVYRSDAGRVLYGGGGITPDLLIPDDTLEGAEREVVLALSRHAAESSEALSELALTLRREVRPDFSVAPAWRRDFLERIRREGVTVDPARLEAGGAAVDRLIERRLAGIAFGDSAVFRRDVPRDSQLQAALGLLRAARTQQETFARAAHRPGE